MERPNTLTCRLWAKKSAKSQSCEMNGFLLLQWTVNANSSKFMNPIWDQADGPSPKSWLHQFHREQVFTGQWAQMNRWRESDSYPQLTLFHWLVGFRAIVWGSLFSQHTQGHWVARQALKGWASEPCSISLPLPFWGFLIREPAPHKVSEPQTENVEWQRGGFDCLESAAAQSYPGCRAECVLGSFHTPSALGHGGTERGPQHSSTVAAKIQGLLSVAASIYYTATLSYHDKRFLLVSFSENAWEFPDFQTGGGMTNKI